MNGDEIDIYRVYMDLYDGGQLSDVLDNYFERPPEAYSSPSSTPEIPESFVWHRFAGLVDACLVLEQGHQEKAVKGWMPLVHNDLHSSNVLLKNDTDGDKVSSLEGG